MPVEVVDGAEVVRCNNDNCASNGGTNDSARNPPPVKIAAGLVLRPMSTAPRPAHGQSTTLLVLDEYQEMGQPRRAWALVYWLDAFEGRPSGWYGNNCSDLRNPVGWVLCTHELPTAFPGSTPDLGSPA